MSIDREHFNGPITFCCDSCGDTEATHCQNFHGALAKVKSYGWVVRPRRVKSDTVFEHFCKDCK
jgi:hypothetical protein